MDNLSVFEKIIGGSINAPSGSNSQPWQFEIGSNYIDIIALPEKDHPILNFQNRGTWIAHGALIENMMIISQSFNMDAYVKYFPDKNRRNLTARIIFKDEISEKKSRIGTLLSKGIKARTTNRKPYNKKSLPNIILSELNSIQLEDDVAIHFVDKPEIVQKLAMISSYNEIVTLENQKLHKLFFDEIVWTSSEEKAKKEGLFLKTMELALPQRIALRVFKNWRIMKLLNRLGVAKGIARGNTKNYAAASMYAVISTKSMNNETFINAGRVLERLWLTIIKHGLSGQIMAGILFFWQSLNGNNLANFSKKHEDLIEDAYRTTKNLLHLPKGETPIMFFRIGFGDNPSAISLKKRPKIVIIE